MSRRLTRRQLLQGTGAAAIAAVAVRLGAPALKGEEGGGSQLPPDVAASGSQRAPNGNGDRAAADSQPIQPGESKDRGPGDPTVDGSGDSQVLVIDPAALQPTDAWRGQDGLSAPVIFLRDGLNPEHEPPRVTGSLAPYRESVPTVHGEATRIEQLASVGDNYFWHTPPMWGGFQTIHQWLGVASCPAGNMAIEFRDTSLELTTQRKWPLAIWAMPEEEFLALGGLDGTPGDSEFMDVVRNRLPQDPFNSILVRPQIFEPSGQPPYIAWVLKFTGHRELRREDSVRHSMWQPHVGRVVDERADSPTLGKEVTEYRADVITTRLRDVRVQMRGHNLEVQSWDGTQWLKVSDVDKFVPDDWIGKQIVWSVQSVDYASSDPGKPGGGTPLAHMHYGMIRIEAAHVDWTASTS